MDAAAKGRFSSLNSFAMTGAGQARFVGTDAEATAVIRGLVFHPTQGRLPLNASETVRFTISVNDNIVTPTINDTTAVTVMNVGGGPLHCTPAPAGMVAFWPGDMNANDLISGLNGTEVGTLFYADGKVSSGFGFDGAGEINVPHDSKLNLETFTIEAWVFPTSLDGRNDMIICKEDYPEVQYELSIKGTIHNVATNIPVGNLAYFIGGIEGLPNDYEGWVNGGDL
ncbi:MAG: hypothetical protein L0Z50_39080 [Verrucomicrobiales bacterium]|nr:hypothetical protein [Verrucomicrobiales bacterium]